MTDSNDYQSLRVLVTGGASGSGHAIASAALARGAPQPGNVSARGHMHEP